MFRKLRIILFLLSFLSLFIIGYDYVCGHIGDNPFEPKYCPVCAIFNSIELGHLLSIDLLFFGIFSLTGFIVLQSTFFNVPLYLSIHPSRSPPFTK